MSCKYKYKGVSYSREDLITELSKDNKVIEQLNSVLGISLQNASKVIDENGMPLLMFHGSNKDINVFDKTKIGKNFRQSELGFYFTNESKVEVTGIYGTTAQEYARNSASGGYAQYGEDEFENIIPVFLNIQNPLLMSDEGWYSAVNYLDKHNSEIKREVGKDKSLDGVITTLEGENGELLNGQQQKAIVVFSPNQIKSATNNIGSFSNESNDIRFQIVGEQGASRIEEYNRKLIEAKQMERDGKSIDEIELKTNWYKTKEGWKMISPEAIKQFNVDFSKIEKNKNYTLDNLIGNENILFKMYPKMGGINVVLVEQDRENAPKNLPPNFRQANGIYNEASKTIFINGTNRMGQVPQKHLYTLAHEVQHIIGNYEGFSRGGNPESILEESVKILKIDKSIRSLNALQEIISKKLKSEKLSSNEYKIVSDSLNTINAIRFNNQDVLFKQYEHIFAEIDAKSVEGALMLRNGGTIVTSYKRLIDFYAKQFNIDLNNAYYLSNGDISFSLSAPKIYPSIPQILDITETPQRKFEEYLLTHPKAIVDLMIQNGDIIQDCSI